MLLLLAVIVSCIDAEEKPTLHSIVLSSIEIDVTIRIMDITCDFDNSRKHGACFLVVIYYSSNI